MEAKKIRIRGLVQGVGFRPFIYRIAIRHKIQGWVENSNEGVKIHVEGSPDHMKSFLAAIEGEAPAASNITKIDIIKTAGENFILFSLKRVKTHRIRSPM